MKRSILLLFVLALLFTFCPEILHAQFIVNSARIILDDNDGNGYANVGDSIVVEVTGNGNILGFPTVDLSSLGLAAQILTPNVNVYSTVSIPLTFRAGNPAQPNYQLLGFTVSGNYDSDPDPLVTTSAATTQVTVNSTFFDMIQVQATAAPTATRTGNTLNIAIGDARWQIGTTARVDLTAVGGANNVLMTPDGSGNFNLTYALPVGTDYAGPFTVTLKDPVVIHPAVSYTTNSLTVDNVYPTIDAAGTSVTILSGNTTALPGDILRLRGRVTSYDGEQVWASSPLLIDAGHPLAAVPALGSEQALSVITSSGPGNPAEWMLDVVLSEAEIKYSSLVVTFRFVDNAGNFSIISRNIAIDLDRPNMISSLVNVLQPDGLDSTLDVATTSCQLEIISTITVAILPDPTTVTVDLSAIGGSANLTMTRIGLSDVYRAVYVVPQGILEDGTAHAFIVSARDTANNIVAQSTTPAIRIDSFPPVLSGVQLTAPTTNILVGTIFTIQCTATGLENGSVSVNLSSIGLSASANLPNAGGNIYRQSFTLPDSRAPGVPGFVDGLTSFVVSVNDTVFPGNIMGHIVTATTNQMMIDNEPPTILSSHSQYDHNTYITDDDGYSRIGDTLNFHVRIASAPVSVKINMVSLGQNSSENMVASAAPTDGLAGWYDYNLPGGVATGTINRFSNMPITISVLDDAGNATATAVLVSIDNRPVDVSGFDVNITYKAGLTDTDSTLINLNKSLHLRVRIAIPVPDDHAPAATIDLSSIGGLANEPMAYANGSYSVTIDTAQTTYDSPAHKFQVLIADLSGNRTAAQSISYRVDCNPPTILSATVEQMTGGAAAITGDTLKFKTQISNNEGTAPTINLTSIGKSATQAMTSTGGGWYEHTTTIGAGSIDEANASWAITVWDNDLNYAQANTNLILIDNFGPDINGNLTLQINGAAVTTGSVIKIGDILDFTVDINNLAGTEGPATIDLRSVGGIASAVMTFNVATTGYSISHTTTQASAEYLNYRFKSYVDDKNANRVVVQSSTVPVVDCQSITFSASGISIWQDNSDNPVAGIANIGDVLMVYASASAHIDAIASATIGSGTVDFATATMIFNATRNRHEALFTVKTPGIDGWGTLTGSTDVLNFKLSGLDDVSNPTMVAPVVSTFTIRNVNPVISFSNITLNPNRFHDLAGTTPVYNLGTDTVGDRLIASISFAGALPMHRAWLDFSELSSGTLDLTVSGDSAMSSEAGVAVSKFVNLDWVQKRVYLKAQDQAGNISIASQSFWIDNVAPVLTSASFDGKTVVVNLSETFANFNYTKFELVGSNPPPLNTPVYLNFSATDTIIEDITSFELTLSDEHMREMAQWASTSIYLKVTNNATSALTDLSGNELRPVNYFPITITDSLWREPARITQFTMTHTWPASITLDLFFNKDIASSSLIASNGVLLFANLSYDLTSIDYTTGYVFQPKDLDNCTWPSNNHLRIVMSADGRDWLARKLGNGATQLRFATRSPAHVFAYDNLGKPMNNIPTSAPILAVDNRPTPGFDFKGPPAAPSLNLASRTLILSASDRVLLTNSNFDVVDTNNPTMGMPVPTLNNRVNSFINKVVLHDIDSGANTVLQLQPIDITVNNLFASSAVTLKLTDDDVSRVINLFKSNATPVWRMAVGAGAFTNLWGTLSNPYLPSGNPGAMTMATPAGYNTAVIAACAMSDKPPVNQKLAGELTFDVEMFPPNIDGTIVPFQSQIVPTARIVNQATSALISSGTFVSYSERTVSGQLRSVFKFTNTANFASSLQKVPSLIEIQGITDIFGNTYSVTASYAYDLNTRNDGAVNGYTDTASAPLQIDTQKPVVTSIVPGDVIGRISAGSTFKVNFDETMNPAVTPILRLSTGTTILNFTFAGWTATATADFTSNSAFTSTLPNGIWYYQVTGGSDDAGNLHDNTLANAFPVEVRTYAPEVVPGDVTLITLQTKISSALLINQPWASIVGDGIFSIKYNAPPSQFLPHYLEIFDPLTNTRLGRATIVSNLLSNMATATFRDIDFFAPPVYPGLTGPTSYATRIIDSAMNQTESLSTLVYDNLCPDVATFDLTGIGSSTASTWYYRQTSGNFNVNVVTTSTTDDLRMAIYSQSANATTTALLSQTFVPGTYSIATGSGLTNGTYTLTIFDMAGNIGSGPSSKRLIADSSSPVVVSIRPNDAIGNSPAGLTEVKVVFSEPMDASAALNPTLEIATAGFTIPMTFVSWVNPLVASTATYVNTSDITSALPAGTYTYRVTSGSDLAGNGLTPTVDGTHQVVVYSQGPFARIDNLTDQRHIYGSAAGMKTNFAFNPAFAAGLATITIDYAGGPFNPPHALQIYKTDGTLVGTYTPVPAIDPATIVFPTDPQYSWIEAPNALTNETYQFKIVDATLNISGGFLPNNLRYDTTTPTVSSISVSAPGIATDTGTGLAWYYSPALGNATFTVITSNSDGMQLLVLKEDSPVATFSAGMTSTNGLTHKATFGSSLVSGTSYTITAVDTAGNIAGGPASRALLIADSVAPTVLAATPSIAGSTQIGAGNFTLTFDKNMNTAVAPTLQLASGTTTIAMTYIGWEDAFTVVFTNAVNIDSAYPPGSYSFIISGARDLAGNQNIIPASGDFEVELFTLAPAFSASLITRQTTISGTTDLINQPFSSFAAPGVATLSISYSAGHPYQAPHSILVYKNDNSLASTAQILPSGSNEVSITNDLLDNPLTAEIYSFRILDSIGNLSATSALKIYYDPTGPDIATFTLTNVAGASVSPRYYYNPALHGGLVASIETSNATDPLRLLLTTGVATSTYLMTAASNPKNHSFTMTTTENNATALPDGLYGVTAVDAAGNFADGIASFAILVVDRIPPAVSVATISNGLYLSSGLPGAATFTITFNENLYNLATPTLAIATTSQSIACRCVSFAANQAVFATSVTVPNSVPQGEYVYQIKATDLTGNILNAATGSVQVRSRGPVIAAIVTSSYQSTTASSTLASGNEIMLNQPFSLNVAPGAATMSLQLARTPDGDASMVYLHFTDLTTGNTTIASYPLALTGNAATFTWSILSGPQPTTPTTYLMRLADSNGDFSLENYEWRIDNASPAVNSLTFTGGENNTASSTIYFNPFKHPYITAKFSAVENEAPKMRVRNSNSTDTYQLSGAGANLWSANFTGVYSRNPAVGSAIRLPDGKYDIGLVDRAGNVAASGSQNLYSMVIDTQSPLVATYSMYVASQPVSTYFSPSAGNLDIFVFSATEPLTATGVYYLEILNLVGTRINKLPLVASASSYLASWNGKNDQGNLVSDGEYTFRASDYVGNIATATSRIFAMTSEFKVTGVTQIASTSAQIWLNHDIQNSSLTATSVTASPAMAISNIRLSGTKTITFDTATAFAHATSYTLTVANGPGGVKNIYGSALTATGSQIIMVADGQGPVIAGHSFTGLSSQNEFKIIFDEAFDITSAGNKASYTLKNASSTVINISQAVPQSDQKTVVITAEQQLVENKDYTIAAAGVTDTLGNTATTTAYIFQGRDLTPPKLVVSAFSNPANEKDIIVLATSDEPLKAPPTLYVKHGSAAAVSTTMQAGANPKAFMAGVSLNAANGNTGTLLVQGEDTSDNQGSGEGSFTIAYVSANMLAQVLSKDNQLMLNFSIDSLKTDATVKILQHQLSKEVAATGIIKTSLQNEFRAARGLRSSQINVESLQNNAELVPVTDSYEVSIATEKVNKGFMISLTAPEATSTVGLGLFNQSGDTWKFVTADLNAEKAFTAKAVSSQIFAVMHDVVAPKVNLDAGLDLSEPFRTSRPEFSGQILESGAGLDNAALSAHIDGGPAQSLQVDSNGQFTFKPLVELTGGNHDLVIKAADRTGNQSQTSALRFVVNVPLNIGQIMQYPNPASRRGYIRISANRDDLNDDLVKISIYDVAGHKVATLNNVRSVKETWNGVNSRFLYDIAWDLRNEDGKQVANGVYFARIEVRDPENPSTKIKKNFKLAVLR